MACGQVMISFAAIPFLHVQAVICHQYSTALGEYHHALIAILFGCYHHWLMRVNRPRLSHTKVRAIYLANVCDQHDATTRDIMNTHLTRFDGCLGAQFLLLESASWGNHAE